jgi:hypothetical protein
VGDDDSHVPSRSRGGGRDKRLARTRSNLELGLRLDLRAHSGWQTSEIHLSPLLGLVFCLDGRVAGLFGTLLALGPRFTPKKAPPRPAIAVVTGPRIASTSFASVARSRTITSAARMAMKATTTIAAPSCKFELVHDLPPCSWPTS